MIADPSGELVWQPASRDASQGTAKGSVPQGRNLVYLACMCADIEAEAAAETERLEIAQHQEPPVSGECCGPH
eukprot:1876028-Pleurochrysis_carterae.AAC.1